MNADILDSLTERVLGAIEASFPVVYKGHCVGEYFADMLVEDALVLVFRISVKWRGGALR